MVDRPRAFSNAGVPQRAAIACQSCRLRKVKCDAQTASSDQGCGPCQRSGLECVLDPLSDGRRSVSRKFVDKLQQRIETLEALNGGQVDRTAWALGPAAEGQSLPVDNAVVFPVPTSPLRGADLPSSSTTRAPLPQGHTTTQPTTESPNGSRERMGGLRSPESRGEGSPSYFGATSHPHVASPGEETRIANSERQDDIGIELDPRSPHVRDKLLRTFFKYQMLWVDVVDKSAFHEGQAQDRNSRWYSRILENAMLACATRLSTSRSIRALGPKLCDLANEDLLSAMSEPTPANLEAFLLLSEYEVTQGNDRRGWMFCGVACRMLSDLGLHDLARNRNARESSLAYGLLSACIVYEGVWTLYLGRPSSIPEPVMDVANTRCKDSRQADTPWLNAWVGLCVPMAEISQVINDQAVDATDRGAMLRKLFKQVEDWYAALPQELAYNEDRLTNMDLAGYGMHTQYCKVQILLRKALAGSLNPKKRRHSQATGDRAPREMTDDSDTITYKHGLRIARLVVTYREAFGIEEIPSIMLDNAVVGATAMINHLNKAENVGEMQHSAPWLRQLVLSLESMQPHYPIVARMLDSLRQICGSGPLQEIFQHPQWDQPDSFGRDRMAPVQSGNSALPTGTAEDTTMLAGGLLESEWNFDVEAAMGVFSSGGLNDSVLYMPQLAP